MVSKDRLSDYRAKRDPKKTPEPTGADGAEGSAPRFVVQRHEASALHFDFRLEIDDVLASWSIPKGPSVNPADKRLAVRTEDHPLDYADFEGRIPEGEYGAGTVIVWDTGGFDNLTDDRIGDALRDGHIKVYLHGDKLTGAFALTRTKLRGSGENWLLVKVDDAGADRRRKPATSQPGSVLTGRKNKDLQE